jgi:hypothetical protein
MDGHHADDGWMGAEEEAMTVAMRSACVVGWIVFVPAAAAAQDDPEWVPPADVVEGGGGGEADGEPPPPWDLSLTVGASLNFADNRSVVGQPDGSSLTLGGSVNFGADFREGDHEWRNAASLEETFTLTPMRDELVKTTDLLQFETIYLYRFLEWLGLYGRARLDLPIFPGYYYTDGATNFRITMDDGTIEEQFNVRELRITGWGSPITLRESLGPFARPLTDDAYNLEIRLGFGGREIFTADNLIVEDDGATADFVEVRGLRDVYQAGIEMILAFWGELVEGKVTYRLGAEFMMPLVNNQLDSDDRNAAELTNMELLAALSFKLVEWASIDYQLKVVREPQVTDDFQIRNNLLLTFSFALI